MLTTRVPVLVTEPTSDRYHKGMMGIGFKGPWWMNPLLSMAYVASGSKDAAAASLPVQLWPGCALTNDAVIVGTLIDDATPHVQLDTVDGGAAVSRQRGRLPGAAEGRIRASGRTVPAGRAGTSPVHRRFRRTDAGFRMTRRRSAAVPFCRGVPKETAMNERSRYDLGFQILHWAMALVILTAWAVAIVMGDMPRGPDKVQMILFHKSLGVTVIALLLLRIVWRAASPPPAPSVQGGPWLHRAAAAGHLALYALMLAVPVVGVALSQAEGRAVTAWGLVTLPTLLGENKELAHTLEELHEVLGNGILALAGLHAAAALVHQYVLKDGVLSRMLPGRPVLRS